LGKARQYLFIQARFDSAIKDLTKAIEINSETLKTNSIWQGENAEVSFRVEEAYWLRGMAYLYKEDFDSAIKDCTKAIETNPKYADAYFLRAMHIQLSRILIRRLKITQQQ
jgi:tetratricopeptide (TPR) repeat protein